jgi:hypothetical protein
VKWAILIGALLGISSAMGATYSGGLPIPGLPKSVGQKTMSGSTSVTLASDQPAIPISGSVTATVSGTNNSVGVNYATGPTSSTQIGYTDTSGRLQPLVAGPNGIGVTGTVSSNQGTSPWVTSRNWVLQGLSDSVGVTGSVSSTQGTSPWVVTGTATSEPVYVVSSTISRVANSTGNQTLAGPNSLRKGLILFNDDSAAICNVKFGATASSTSFTFKLYPLDTYFMQAPLYQGQVDFLCSASTGSMEVNEL